MMELANGTALVPLKWSEDLKMINPTIIKIENQQPLHTLQDKDFLRNLKMAVRPITATQDQIGSQLCQKFRITNTAQEYQPTGLLDEKVYNN